MNQPSFPSLVGSLNQHLKATVFATLTRHLRLTKSQEVVLRIALSDIVESRDSLKQKLGELFTNFEALQVKRQVISLYKL